MLPRLRDLDSHVVDIAIRYRSDVADDAGTAKNCVLERGYPVCSPALANTPQALNRLLVEGRLL
ncbi:hypothetical protein [Salinicola peritrichatus]|uniref:hypothetical protein n=1 Tax=Salinicola peritrichatus TaxID=1267424 RepID=UPI0013A61C24|nr:hypothetical protein [Salinicola peritrichatus]